VPVYLDSPMANTTLDVYRDAIGDDTEPNDPDVRPDLAGTDPFGIDELYQVRDVEDSKELNEMPGPMIIISASGMITGGRVVHHVARRAPDHRNAIVLIGFQAAGTRGRLLADGARALKMLGRYWPVRAEVVHLPAFSVHADRDELLGWLSDNPCEPDTVYVVHGEPDSSAAFAATVAETTGWIAVVPEAGERVRLD